MTTHLTAGEEPSRQREDLLGAEGDVEGLPRSTATVEDVEKGLVASLESENGAGSREKGRVGEEARLRSSAGGVSQMCYTRAYFEEPYSTEIRRDADRLESAATEMKVSGWRRKGSATPRATLS